MLRLVAMKCHNHQYFYRDNISRKTASQGSGHRTRLCPTGHRPSTLQSRRYYYYYYYYYYYHFYYYYFLMFSFPHVLTLIWGIDILLENLTSEIGVQFEKHHSRIVPLRVTISFKACILL